MIRMWNWTWKSECFQISCFSNVVFDFGKSVAMKSIMFSVTDLVNRFWSPMFINLETLSKKSMAVPSKRTTPNWLTRQSHSFSKGLLGNLWNLLETLRRKFWVWWNLPVIRKSPFDGLTTFLSFVVSESGLLRSIVQPILPPSQSNVTSKRIKESCTLRKSVCFSWRNNRFV